METKSSNKYAISANKINTNKQIKKKFIKL